MLITENGWLAHQQVVCWLHGDQPPTILLHLYLLIEKQTAADQVQEEKHKIEQKVYRDHLVLSNSMGYTQEIAIECGKYDETLDFGVIIINLQGVYEYDAEIRVCLRMGHILMSLHSFMRNLTMHDLMGRIVEFL